jgi:hypothetical protein
MSPGIILRCLKLRDSTYKVTSGVLLLSLNATGTLGSVQGTLALDDGLARGSASSTELAANLGGAFPVRHSERLDLGGFEG